MPQLQPRGNRLNRPSAEEPLVGRLQTALGGQNIAHGLAYRALPAPAGALPILALTANADERDERDYVAAGMNGVAQKPIQPDALLNAIRLVLTEAAAVPAAA